MNSLKDDAELFTLVLVGRARERALVRLVDNVMMMLKTMMSFLGDPLFFYIVARERDPIFISPGYEIILHIKYEKIIRLKYRGRY